MQLSGHYGPEKWHLPQSLKRNGPVLVSNRLHEVLNPWPINWANEEVVDDVTAPDIWSKRHLPRRIPARLLKFRLLTGTFRWWFPIGIARLHVVDSRSDYPTSIKHTLNAWSDWIFWGWLAQLGVPLRRRSLKITEPLPVRCQSMVWKPSFFLPHLSSKTEQTHNMTQWRNAPVLKGSETYTFNLFSPQLWRTTAAYWT